MELELKHLVGYLPYGVKCSHARKKGNIKSIDILTIDTWFITKRDYFKPILRPLSDLTKEIEHNGEKFVPVNKILEIFGKSLKHLSTEYQVKALHSFELEVITKELPYRYIQKLIEWHFDIYGLIPAGLAIDINTI